MLLRSGPFSSSHRIVQTKTSRVYSVNWGDGNTTSGHTGDASHMYATAGTYTVSISVDFPAIQFRSSTSSSSNDKKLRTIEQWGSQVWQSMEQAFEGCSNFNSDLNDWDVSNVICMKRILIQAEVFNGDIRNWNVSNVNNMENMFANASLFNQDFGGWDVPR